jgi:DNA modification methylase
MSGNRDVVDATLYGLDLFGTPAAPESTGSMAERFLFPPFSVLNETTGAWQERKRAWINLGIRAQEGRADGLAYQKLSNTPDYMKNMVGKDMVENDTGSSVFDPVLCEVIYNWFCPVNGSILDPFAGECTKGIVATQLGFDYTGIELRTEQVQANEEQARKIGLKPTWICGDSTKLGQYLPTDKLYDFIWTSPPYYDLEVYSSDEADGSAISDYPSFMLWYTDIFQKAVKHLKENRFLAVKVGEIRDKKNGEYRNFVGDNITCFMRGCGLHYYNEIILITPAGTLPIRAGKPFETTRKIGKTHQNILVFYKGDTRNIKEEWPRIIVEEPKMETTEEPAMREEVLETIVREEVPAPVQEIRVLPTVGEFLFGDPRGDDGKRSRYDQRRREWND